jgi:hypothetical protein
MSLEQAILEAVRALPAEKQQEILALSENSIECPIGAGFRISGRRPRSAAVATAACRLRIARRDVEVPSLPGEDALSRGMDGAGTTREISHSMEVEKARLAPAASL